MAENNEKGYELYRVFLSAHAFLLKYEHEIDETEGRLQGFISGMWFSGLIDVACYKSLIDYNRRVVKSIIRHYKKIKEWREIKWENMNKK